uniref:DUF7597 domain-containing protein n=1 Tax=Arundo donax TaxID=35708 RepID=A0A0A9A3P5_ARUDO
MVTGCIAHANENLTISTISPLPDSEIPFVNIRDVLLDFVVDERRMQIKDIQPCPFGRGQAYIKLSRVHERDLLVHGSPHNSDGLTFEFMNHNREANCRAVNFNREC